MNFWKYLTFRIGARESEKVIYKGVDAIKNIDLNPQFPSFFRSIGSGIAISLGYIVLYIILTAFELNYINWIIPSLFGLILAIPLFFKKYTHAMKEESIKVKDRRFKEGNRIEYRLVPDNKTLVELSTNHRIIYWIEALILLIGVGLILYAQFEIYPTLNLNSN